MNRLLSGSIVSKIVDPLNFDTFGCEVLQIQTHEIVNFPPAVVEVRCDVKYFLLYYYFPANRAQEKKQLKDVRSPDDGSSELKMALSGIATEYSGHNH